MSPTVSHFWMVGRTVVGRSASYRTEYRASKTGHEDHRPHPRPRLRLRLRLLHRDRHQDRHQDRPLRLLDIPEIPAAQAAPGVPAVLGGPWSREDCGPRPLCTTRLR